MIFKYTVSHESNKKETVGIYIYKLTPPVVFSTNIKCGVILLRKEGSLTSQTSWIQEVNDSLMTDWDPRQFHVKEKNCFRQITNFKPPTVYFMLRFSRPHHQILLSKSIVKIYANNNYAITVEFQFRKISLPRFAEKEAEEVEVKSGVEKYPLVKFVYEVFLCCTTEGLCNAPKFYVSML